MDNKTERIHPKIDINQTTKQRIEDYIKQVGNPYCYQYNGITVRVSFAGKGKIEDCIKTVILRDNNNFDLKDNGMLC